MNGMPWQKRSRYGIFQLPMIQGVKGKTSDLHIDTRYGDVDIMLKRCEDGVGSVACSEMNLSFNSQYHR